MISTSTSQRPHSGLARTILINPGTVVLVAMGLLVLGVIASAGGDPLALARLGTRYSAGAVNGSEGYDGQFVYYIARELDPLTVAPQLDSPAYRYQRILLPVLARALSFGNLQALPWMLALIGIISQAAGTWAVGQLLSGMGISRWYSLVYGLWAGLVLAVRLDLPEPLAYACVAGGLLASTKERRFLATILYGLAIFGKEVTLLFVLGQFAADLLQRRYRMAAILGVGALLPYAAFQVWLASVFGSPGFGSGGAMATPFEWVPFLGFLRIGQYSWVYLLAMSFVFGPAVIWPAIWGTYRAVRSLLASDKNVIVLSLLFNALIIPFIPFSTFRETGGLMRFATGLVLAILLYAARYRVRRVLNYSFFWIALNAFLLKQ